MIATGVIAFIPMFTLGTDPSHIFFDFDNDRPAIGIHYSPAWDKQEDLAQLGRLRNAVDFVQVSLFAADHLAPDGIQPRYAKRAAYQVEVLEEAAIPWSGTVHGILEWGAPDWLLSKHPKEVEVGIEGERPERKRVTSVSKYAVNAWAIQERGIKTAIEQWGDSPHLIGWNSGSEPHIFGWWNGINPHGIGASPVTMRQFREWLQAIFADATPADDTNRDGVTFNSRCNCRFSSWAQVTAEPLSRNEELRNFHDRFLCKLVGDYIRRTAGFFQQHDKRHFTISRLMALTNVSNVCRHLLSNYALPDVIGFTLYPCRRVGGDPREYGFDASFGRSKIKGIEKAAFSIHPPFSGRGTGFIDFLVDVDDCPGPILHFFTGQAAPPENQSDGILFRAYVGEKKVFEHHHLNQGWHEHSVSLKRWRGRRIKLRLETGPGPKRDARSDWAWWGEPRIIMGARRLNLLARYRDAKLGRKHERRRTRYLKPPLRDFDPSMNDFAFGLMSGHAMVTGKRVAFVEAHPTIDTYGMCQWSIMHQVFRSCVHKPAVFTFFCYQGNQKRMYPTHDLAPYRDELARVRSLLALLRPFRAIERNPRYALFLPEFVAPQKFPKGDPRATNRPLVEVVARMGMNIHPLRDIDQARHYEGVVVMLGTHETVVGDAVARFLRSSYDGKVVILQHEVPLTGMPRVSRELLSFLRQARDDWRGRMRSFGKDQRLTVFSSPRRWLYVFGMPVANLDSFLLRHFGESGQHLSYGRFHILGGSAKIVEEGLYLLESEHTCALDATLVAYDFLNEEPAGKLRGPGLFHVFNPRRPRLVDTGLMFLSDRSPDEIGLIAGGSEQPSTHGPWVLCLRAGQDQCDRNELTLFASSQPTVLVGAERLKVEELGHGFYRFPLPKEPSVRCEIKFDGGW